MAKSIVQTSNQTSTKDILLVDWNFIYNSLYYVEVDLYFNTDLSVLETNYGGSGYLKVVLKDGTNDYVLSLSNRTTSTTKINGSQLNDGDDDIYVPNNKITATFDYIPQGTIRLSENTPIYFIEVTINESDTYEFTFNTNSSNDISGVGNRTIANSTNNVNDTLLDLVNTKSVDIESIISNGYFYDINDTVTFYAFNEGTETGISSNSIGSINNKVTQSSINSNRGFTWLSTSTLDFDGTTSLLTEVTYDLNPSSVKGKIVKAGVIGGTSDIDVSSFNEIVIAQDIEFDDPSIILNDSLGTSGDYEIYVPILEDVATVDATLTMTGAFVNQLITFNNGVATFTIIYPPTQPSDLDPYVTTVGIVTNNGLSFTKPLSFSNP